MCCSYCGQRYATQHANNIFNPLSHFHLLMKGGNILTTYIPWILLSMFINVHLMCWYSWVYRYIHWIFHPQRPELMKYLCRYLIEKGKLNFNKESKKTLISSKFLKLSRCVKLINCRVLLLRLWAININGWNNERRLNYMSGHWTYKLNKGNIVSMIHSWDIQTEGSRFFFFLISCSLMWYIFGTKSYFVWINSEFFTYFWIWKPLRC